MRIHGSFINYSIGVWFVMYYFHAIADIEIQIFINFVVIIGFLSVDTQVV